MAQQDKSAMKEINEPVHMEGNPKPKELDVAHHDGTFKGLRMEGYGKQTDCPQGCASGK